LKNEPCVRISHLPNLSGNCLTTPSTNPSAIVFEFRVTEFSVLQVPYYRICGHIDAFDRSVVLGRTCAHGRGYRFCQGCSSVSHRKNGWDLN